MNQYKHIPNEHVYALYTFNIWLNAKVYINAVEVIFHINCVTIIDWLLIWCCHSVDERKCCIGVCD